MNKLYLFLSFLLAFFLFNKNANAHVRLITPTGGENIIVNEVVIIKWETLISHPPQNGWDLYFSTDGGNSWETIQEGIPTSQVEYEWIVPGSPTQQAKVRIVQDNLSTDYDDISGNFSITQNTTGINETTNLTESFTLFQNYPNPFNPSTTISYNIYKTSFVQLKIYNLHGEEIKTLVAQIQSPNNYSFTWGGLNENKERVISGIYFYRLNAGNFTQSKKMMLIK